MLAFLKKFFGAKTAVSPSPEAPYKVETPVVDTAPAKKPRAKTTVKKTTTRKPKAK